MSMDRPEQTVGDRRAAIRQQVALAALLLLGAFYLGSLVYLKTMSVDYVIAIKAKPAN